MARWLVDASGAAHGLHHAASSPASTLVLLSTVVLFFACVTKLVALCAAHGNPQVLSQESEPEAGPEVLATPDHQSSRKLSQRFSPKAIHAKLSSFRKSSAFPSFNPSSSFRNSSFRLDCNHVEVVDAIQRLQPGRELEPDETSKPGTPAVWQKRVLRGERCAPLEFSGLILYDERGNPVPTLHNNRRALHT